MAANINDTDHESNTLPVLYNNYVLKGFLQKHSQSVLKPENVDLGAMYAKSLEGDES